MDTLDQKEDFYKKIKVMILSVRKTNINMAISLSGIGSACCNPSVWGDGIRGWLEDGSPPKEVARSLWCLHQPYGHVKPPLGDGMALGVG